MLKSIVISTAIMFSTVAHAGYGVDMNEDCAQPDQSIADQVHYYNDDNAAKGLIHPAIYKTNEPDKTSTLSTNQLKKLAEQFWDNILTDQDAQIAEECGALHPDDIK